MNSFRRAAILSLSLLAGVSSSEVWARPGLVNGSFELPAAAPGGFVNGSINGWSGPTGQVFWYGVAAQSALPPLIDGSQAAFVNNFGTGSGIPSSHAIAQQLDDVFEPNTFYTFSAFMGWRNDNAESLGTIEIWAGGTVSQGDVIGGTMLVSKSVSLTKGQFIPASVTCLTHQPWDLVGQKLSVRLVGRPKTNTFAQTNFDAAKFYRAQLRTCPGDLNADGLVDDADFVIFLNGYNDLLCPEAPATCLADLYVDAMVDDTDFTVFLAYYNMLVCPVIDPTLEYISQNRSVHAGGCPASDASAPDFGPFNTSVSAGCSLGPPPGLFAGSNMSQNSTLSPTTISVTNSGSAGQNRYGSVSSSATFSVTFDVPYQGVIDFPTFSGFSGPGGSGGLTGPGVNITFDNQFLAPAPVLVQAGRYTLTSNASSPVGFPGGVNTSVTMRIQGTP